MTEEGWLESPQEWEQRVDDGARAAPVRRSPICAAASSAPPPEDCPPVLRAPAGMALRRALGREARDPRLVRERRGRRRAPGRARRRCSPARCTRTWSARGIPVERILVVAFNNAAAAHLVGADPGGVRGGARRVRAGHRPLVRVGGHVPRACAGGSCASGRTPPASRPTWSCWTSSRAGCCSSWRSTRPPRRATTPGLMAMLAAVTDCARSGAIGARPRRRAAGIDDAGRPGAAAAAVRPGAAATGPRRRCSTTPGMTPKRCETRRRPLAAAAARTSAGNEADRRQARGGSSRTCCAAYDAARDARRAQALDRPRRPSRTSRRSPPTSRASASRTNG